MNLSLDQIRSVDTIRLGDRGAGGNLRHRRGHPAPGSRRRPQAHRALPRPLPDALRRRLRLRPCLFSVNVRSAGGGVKKRFSSGRPSPETSRAGSFSHRIRRGVSGRVRSRTPRGWRCPRRSNRCSPECPGGSTGGSTSRSCPRTRRDAVEPSGAGPGEEPGHSEAACFPYRADSRRPCRLPSGAAAGRTRCSSGVREGRRQLRRVADDWPSGGLRHDGIRQCAPLTGGPPHRFFDARGPAGFWHRH